MKPSIDSKLDLMEMNSIKWISNCYDEDQLNAAEEKILGKQSFLTELLNDLRNIPIEYREQCGLKINEFVSKIKREIDLQRTKLNRAPIVLEILEADHPNLKAMEAKRKAKHEEYLKTKTLNRDTFREALAIFELSLRHKEAEFIPNDIKEAMQKICEYYKGPFRVHEKIGPATINMRGIKNLNI